MSSRETHPLDEMGDEGLMHLELNHLGRWKETKTGEDTESEEIEREDKIICLWSKTDLYLFEGDKHAQIQDIRHHRGFNSKNSNYSCKKMKRST